MGFRKNLSEATLKTLIAEMIFKTLEPGEYVFEDYKINILKNGSDRLPGEKNPKHISANNAKKRLYEKRKKAGLCVKCNVKVNQGIYCNTCKEIIKTSRKKRIDRYNRYKKEGRCTDCGKKELYLTQTGNVSVLCKTCYENKHNKRYG